MQDKTTAITIKKLIKNSEDDKYLWTESIRKNQKVF